MPPATRSRPGSTTSSGGPRDRRPRSIEADSIVAHIELPRRLVAEALGTALLIVAVVGSGIMATRLSPDDVGLQLLENAAATAAALIGLILVFGPVSGAHFNPVVSTLASSSLDPLA